MRGFALALILVVALPLALPADAAGPIAPTLAGPTFVYAARDWTYGGQLVVTGTSVPAPVFDRTIGIYLDGTRIGETATDVDGDYFMRLSLPVGTHTLQTRVFEGDSLESESNALVVASQATFPAPPGRLNASVGFYYTGANVTWSYPWTDGGYPVTTFTVERSDSGGPFNAVFTGNALGFVDAVLPGGLYRYRATATTSWGTSNATIIAAYNSSPYFTNVSILGYRLCDRVACLDVPDGGSFTTATSAANVSVQARVEGFAGTYPLAPPGVAAIPIDGRITLPDDNSTFLRGSGAGGWWNATLSGLHAHAPAAGCETIPVTAHARTPKQGRWEDTGSFTLCVAP